MEELNTMVDEVLNKQSDLIWKWRAHITSLLTKPLNPEKDETVDGQEYQRTLDDQGEAETYLQAYGALVADRREAMVSERTLLAAHDAREKKLRQTQAAMRAAEVAEDLDTQLFPEGLDIRPEHEVMHKELSAQRKAFMLNIENRCVKSVSE
jgi:E3 ubiquitin-protein ligase SHPRH